MKKVLAVFLFLIAFSPVLLADNTCENKYNIFTRLETPDNGLDKELTLVRGFVVCEDSDTYVIQVKSRFLKGKYISLNKENFKKFRVRKALVFELDADRFLKYNEVKR